MNEANFPKSKMSSIVVDQLDSSDGSVMAPQDVRRKSFKVKVSPIEAIDNSIENISSVSEEDSSDFFN